MCLSAGIGLLLSQLAVTSSENWKHRLERWLRGKEEFRKLEQADCVIVSFGKSGRTWLRVLLSRFYQVRHGLSERHLIGFDNLHRRNSAIPRIYLLCGGVVGGLFASKLISSATSAAAPVIPR